MKIQFFVMNDEVMKNDYFCFIFFPSDSDIQDVAQTLVSLKGLGTKGNYLFYQLLLWTLTWGGLLMHFL